MNIIDTLYGALTRSLFTLEPCSFHRAHLLFKLFIISFGAFKSGNFSIQASNCRLNTTAFLGTNFPSIFFARTEFISGPVAIKYRPCLILASDALQNFSRYCFPRYKWVSPLRYLRAGSLVEIDQNIEFASNPARPLF